MAVGQWTGGDARLLRQALRLSVRGFASFLGVSVRTVSRWEQHGLARTPRPEFQAILDTVLRQADDEACARFQAARGAAEARDRRSSPAGPRPATRAIAEAASEATDFLVWWEGQATSEAAVDAVFAELRRLAAAYLDGAPEPVIGHSFICGQASSPCSALRSRPLVSGTST